MCLVEDYTEVSHGSSVDIWDIVNMGVGHYLYRGQFLAFFVFYLLDVKAKYVPRFFQMPPRREGSNPG